MNSSNPGSLNPISFASLSKRATTFPTLPSSNSQEAKFGSDALLWYMPLNVDSAAARCLLCILNELCSFKQRIIAAACRHVIIQGSNKRVFPVGGTSPNMNNTRCTSCQNYQNFKTTFQLNIPKGTACIFCNGSLLCSVGFGVDFGAMFLGSSGGWKTCVFPLL